LELLEITSGGTLISIFEQPVFGTIKDINVLHSRIPHPMIYDPIDDCILLKSEDHHDIMRIVPGQDILMCLSDSGMLSFLVYTECFNDKNFAGGNKGKGKAVVEDIGSCVENSRKSGRFQVIKEVRIILTTLKENLI